MSCKKCDSKLIFLNDTLTCPQCNKIRILDRKSALKIAEKRKSYIRELWKKELGKCNRDSLVCHILNDRDRLSWDVFQKPGITDIDKMFSDTLFVKRIFEDGNKDGMIIIDAKSKSEPIIELFNDTKKIETDYYLVESENATYVYEKDFKLEDISNEQALEDFSFVHTEEYEKLIKNFEKNNIVSREKGEKLQKENEEEYKKIFEERRKPITQTVEEFIRRNYDTIASYYLVFLRNEIYSQTFDLREFKKLTDNPRKLMEFVKKFPQRNYTMNGPDYSVFIKTASDVFGKSEEEISKMMVFDENNLDVFPLFVRIRTEGKDIVLISQTFTAIMFILLHAIISKDVFDLISHELGSKFEKEVQRKFESLGFNYIPNHKDDPNSPTLEIDGIASKNGKGFVIEDKNPRLPPEVESFQAKENMIQDIKGIIDGEKRTTKREERVVEQINSLPEKVEYVKNHLVELGLSEVSPDKVVGIVVTNNYPLISEYKGHNILALSEISNDKLDEIMNKN